MNYSNLVPGLEIEVGMRIRIRGSGIPRYRVEEVYPREIVVRHIADLWTQKWEASDIRAAFGSLGWTVVGYPVSMEYPEGI